MGLPDQCPSSANTASDAHNTYMTIVGHKMQWMEISEGDPVPSCHHIQSSSPDPQPYLAPSRPEDFMELRHGIGSKGGFHSQQPRRQSEDHTEWIYHPTGQTDPTVHVPMSPRRASSVSDPYLPMHPSPYPALPNNPTPFPPSPALPSSDSESLHLRSTSPVDVTTLPHPFIDSTEKLQAVLYQRSDCLAPGVSEAGSLEYPHVPLPSRSIQVDVATAGYPEQTSGHTQVNEQPLHSQYFLAGNPTDLVPSEHEKLHDSISSGQSSDHDSHMKPHHNTSEEELQAMMALLKEDEDFKETDTKICERVLRKYPKDLEMAKQEIKVELLLGMGLAYIQEQDCLRALGHCQWKVERAALWLMDQSHDIANR